MMLFDTLQGRIDLAPTILFANRARRDIEADGVTLTNEIRQKNGWTHVTAGRFQSDGQPIVLSLSFLRDRLGKAHLFLEDAEAAGPEDLRRRHDDFLRSMLGPPTSRNKLGISYDYSWGEISSFFDPRNGSVGIVIVWK